MLRSSQFKISSVLFSLFTPGLTFSPNKILAETLPKWKTTFDGDVLTLPVPVDAPPDIPRLIMSSQDKKLKIEISPSRVNISRYSRSIDDEILVPNLIDLIKDIFETYISITKATIGRMAIVLVRYLEKDNPGIELSRHFCRVQWLEKQPLNRPENFELHAHKRYNLLSHQINSWVRCKTGRLSFPDYESKKIILVEQDINTLAEDMDSKEYNINDVVPFVKEADKELNHILNLYFPDVQNG